MSEAHECRNCENFDLSTNMCLQHNEMGYDCDKQCLHTDCQNWTQCSGFVPDDENDIFMHLSTLSTQNMPDERHIKYLRHKAVLFDKIANIVNNTDSYWDCDVKAAYIEIEKIVKGNLDHE